MVSRHLPESSQLLLLLIASVHADDKVAALGINHEGSWVLDLNSLKTGVILPRLLNCYGDHSRKCTRRRQRKSQNMEMPHCPVLCSHRLGSHTLGCPAWIYVQYSCGTFQEEFFDAWLRWSQDPPLSGHIRSLLRYPFSEFEFGWWSFGSLRS